jgi:hypothetical protein
MIAAPPDLLDVTPPRPSVAPTGLRFLRRRVWVAVAAAGAAALAGCGSSGGTIAPPSWQASLGSGVTVLAPLSPSAPTISHDSPGGVVQGLVEAVNSGKLINECAAFPPAVAKECRADTKGQAETAKYTNEALGFVAIKGTEALVGQTGELCDPDEKPECATNTDPAAILDSGKSFDTLFQAAVAEEDSNSTSNVYELVPCIEDGSQWYVDLKLS